MNINQLKTSNFLKRDDVGDGTIVTIRSISQQNVAKEGAPEEMKWCLHVDEFDKGMVLNSTNGQLIAHALKSEESEDWIGQKVILFDDPSVSFGGKLVGGIRVRALPKTATAPARAVNTPAVNPKAALKARLKAHPQFGKAFDANTVNDYTVKAFGVKMDEVSESDAQTMLDTFDDLVATFCEEPF